MKQVRSIEAVTNGGQGMTMLEFLMRLLDRGDRSEAGMTTAELLGNAALGVLALVVIWGLLQSLGVDIVNWIRGQLL